MTNRLKRAKINLPNRCSVAEEISIMFGFMLQTVFEIAVATFIIWGLFNEKTLIRFEDRIIAALKKKFKLSRSKRNVYRHETRCGCDDRNCA